MDYMICSFICQEGGPHNLHKSANMKNNN